VTRMGLDASRDPLRSMRRAEHRLSGHWQGGVWPIEQLRNDPGYHRLMQGLNDFARVIVYDKRGTFRGTGCLVVPSLRERTPPPRR
jgi:hypothetical protein